MKSRSEKMFFDLVGEGGNQLGIYKQLILGVLEIFINLKNFPLFFKKQVNFLIQSLVAGKRKFQSLLSKVHILQKLTKIDCRVQIMWKKSPPPHAYTHACMHQFFRKSYKNYAVTNGMVITPTMKCYAWIRVYILRFKLAFFNFQRPISYFKKYF